MATVIEDIKIVKRKDYQFKKLKQSNDLSLVETEISFKVSLLTTKTITKKFMKELEGKIQEKIS